MSTFKKLTSLLLCVVVLCGCVFTAAAVSDAHYDPPLRIPPLSGTNVAADIYTVAKSQVGYEEDVYDRTYFGEWWTEVVSGREYDDFWKGKIDIDCTKADWCAIFLCWCMEKAGCVYGANFNVLSGTVGYMFELLKADGAQVYEYSENMTYKPKTGDLVFYTYDGGVTLSHVAVTDGKNNYIHANYADSVVERKGNLVYKASADDWFSPAYVVSPAYKTESSGLLDILPGVQAGIIYLPYRLELEINKLFETDDDTGYVPSEPPVIVDEVIPGDADRDGVVSAADARIVLRASVGLFMPDEEQMKRADLNADGSCTADEARLILRAAVGLEELIA